MYPSAQLEQSFATTPQDWFNHAAGFGISNCLIQSVLHFDRSIDAAVLLRAINLAADLEPVMKCDFIKHPEIPVWKMGNRPVESFLELIESDTPESVLEGILARSIRTESDPQVHFTLIRGDQKDTLCIRVNHSCSDAGGSRLLIQRLALLYSRLESEPGYRESPQGLPERSHKPLVLNLGIKNPVSLWDPNHVNHRSPWSFPHRSSGSGTTAWFVFHRIPAERFQRLNGFAKSNRVTINDLLLTAYFRALVNRIGCLSDRRYDVSYTVDLRRYLHPGETIGLANLSAFELLELTPCPEESFSSTLSRVRAYLEPVRASNPGFMGIVACELMERMSFDQFLRMNETAWNLEKDTGTSTPFLSNLGTVSNEPIRFGAALVEDAFVVTPAFHAPAFMLGVSTYQEIMTLVAGFFKPDTDEKQVSALLEHMGAELKGLVN